MEDTVRTELKELVAKLNSVCVDASSILPKTLFTEEGIEMAAILHGLLNARKHLQDLAWPGYSHAAW